MRDLNGKVAWVTGAGSGIGEAGAMALAREGACVILTGGRKGALGQWPNASTPPAAAPRT